MKKLFCIFLSSLFCVSLTACTQQSGHATENSIEDSEPSMSVFNDYSWGTPQSEIEKSEIKENMNENLDYKRINNENNLTSLAFTMQKVYGYDSSVEYIFSDGKLTAGAYSPYEMNKEDYDKLFSTLQEKYGDAIIQKDTTGWGRLAVWTDNSKNVLFLSEILDIGYSESGSPALEFLNDQFIYFHEIDLLSELKKISSSSNSL